jgi:MFS family permease
MTSTTLTQTRTAGATQGWTLASANWLSVIATSVIAPVLPMIQTHFSSDANVGVMIGLVATIPALFVAICAWPAGWLADKFGLRTVLLIAVGLYGFAGCAPMVLDNLTGIVISRAGVGILEAAIMTVTTALVADYFHGNVRERWLAVQTGGASVIATVMVLLGGIMGQTSWRFPFLMYAFGFILFPLCLFKIWQPTDKERISVQQADNYGAKNAVASSGETFKWGPMIPLFVIAFLASTAFYVLLIQLGFILVDRGITVGSAIGITMAVMSVCMSLGAVIFKFLPFPVPGKLMVSFAFASIGFAVIAVAPHTLYVTIVGSAITGLGTGMITPTLITWTLSKLTTPVRARGTGIWQACFFLGQFASPQIILFLRTNFGGISNAVLIYSGFMAVAAVIALIFLIKGGFSKQTVEA